jgi:hypothetical protein
MQTLTYLITPSVAGKILDQHNSKNKRGINKQNAQAYARDMTAGKWALTHQGLAFTGESMDAPGDLVDGQTRLTAIMISGKSVNMRVTFGAEDIGKIDFGRKRSVTCVTGICKEQVAICYVILNSIRANQWSIYHVELLTERFPRLHEIAKGTQRVKGLTNAQMIASFAVAHEDGCANARRWFREMAEISPLMPQPINTLYKTAMLRSPEMFCVATTAGATSHGYICGLRAIKEAEAGGNINKFYPDRLRESLSEMDGIVGALIRENLI